MPRDYAYCLVCAATFAGVVIACLDSNAAPSRVAVPPAASPVVSVPAPQVRPASAAAEKMNRREQRLAQRAARRGLERANAAAVAAPAKTS